MVCPDKGPFRMPREPGEAAWTGALEFAKRVGAEACVAAVSICSFAHYGITDWRLLAYGLSVLWSLFAFKILWRRYFGP
jgi:hypothetical protein